MNKLELTKTLQDETQLTKAEAKHLVAIFFGEMAEALADGGRVELRGLCSFYVKEYPSYTGRNPKTGAKVTVSPKKLPFFKCSRELQKRVNPY